MRTFIVQKEPLLLGYGSHVHAPTPTRSKKHPVGTVLTLDSGYNSEGNVFFLDPDGERGKIECGDLENLTRGPDPRLMEQRDPRRLDPIDEAFIITEAKILDQSATANWPRRRMEIAVVRALLKTLAADGWELSVDDGDYPNVTGTLPELMAAVFSVDVSSVIAAKNGAVRSAFIVLGNDGWDAICDHTDDSAGTFEKVLAPVWKVVDDLQAECEASDERGDA